MFFVEKFPDKQYTLDINIQKQIKTNLNRKEKTTMLRNIPPILSPELLKVLAEMGHGDTIVIGDANFAAASMAKKRNSCKM